MSSMFLISVQDPTTRPSLSPWAWPAGAASYSPPSGARLLIGLHPSHQRSDYDARKFVHPCLCCTRWWDSWPATCAAGQRQLPSCSGSRRQKRKEQPWNVLTDPSWAAQCSVIVWNIALLQILLLVVKQVTASNRRIVFTWCWMEGRRWRRMLERIC